MNYEEMSDFEINKLVVEVIYCGAENPSVSKKFPSMGGSLTESSMARVEFADLSVIDVNFCRSWGDAGCIISNENLDLTSPYGTGGDEWQVSRHSIHHSKPSITVFHKNPLRAAMICFLKMKDAQL